MDVLALRAYHTCTGDKQWYTCSAGDYAGCCSMDPCTNGVCTVDDSDDTTTKTTSTSKYSTQTSTESATSTSQSTSSATTTQTTPHATDLTVDSQSSPISSALSTSASATVSTSSTSSKSSQGTIIGGVVSGVVAALLIIGAIIFWCRKRKRERRLSYHLEQTLHTPDPYHGPYSSGPSRKNSSYPLLSRHDTGSNIPIAMSGALAPGNGSMSNLYQSTAPVGFNYHSASSSRRQQHPPELPDTALQRTHVELASYSQKELINVPLDQRQHHKQRQPSAFSWVATPTAGLPTPDTPPGSPASITPSSAALPSSASVNIIRDRPSNPSSLAGSSIVVLPSSSSIDKMKDRRAPKPSSIAASSVALPSSSSMRIVNDHRGSKPGSITASPAALPSSTSANIIGDAPQPSSPNSSISSPSMILNTRLILDNTPQRPSNSASNRQHGNHNSGRPQETSFMNFDSSPYSDRSDTGYSPQTTSHSSLSGQRKPKDRRRAQDPTFLDDASIHSMNNVPAVPKGLRIKRKIRY